MEFLQILISFIIFRYKKKGLEGYMNRLFFVLVSSVALMFAACGDSGNGASPHSNADMDVQTYSELPSCAEKRDGKTAYVADQEQGYICQNGKWVEDDDVEMVTQSEVKGSLMDSRDGQTYRIVTIGSQTWMAENLNYETANSYCYKNKTSNCTKYGRLYTWAAAMDSAGKWSSNGNGCGYGKTCSPTYPVRGVCPTGWHLPTKAEFETLFTAVGGGSTAGKMLKSTSGWDGNGNGTDAYSFSALSAGFRNYGGNYGGEGYDAYFWSSTEDDSDYAYGMDLYYDGGGAGLFNDYKNNGNSVRCVKDNALSSGKTSSSSAVIRSSSSVTPPKSSSSVKVTEPAEVTIGSITDSRDGQTYKTVSIGSQTWMAQNLNYKTDNSYCYDDSPSNCTKYGRLYTWAAAKTACPTGWHLPDTTEWNTLFTAVGGSSTAGKMLKSTSGWNSSGNSVSGTDNYSFSALPAGFRRNGGNYDSEGFYAYFWSSTENGSGYAYDLDMLYNDGGAYLRYGSEYYGFSVRCVKD